MEEENRLVGLEAVHKVVEKHYGEELWLPVKAAIGVIASLSIKGRDHCLVLVFEGASGQGKSIVIRLMMPNCEATKKYLHRVDDFTPASFVSHAANKSKKQLEQINLLPKIKDKVMATKELAPLFQGEEKEMRKNFATLTSVLDGNGFIKASGVHGAFGYEGQYVFNWLGATTPIAPHTHKIMAQLGNRILFYEVSGKEWLHDELIKFAKAYGKDDAVAECQDSVNLFLEAHFAQYPVGTIAQNEMALSRDLLSKLVCYATLVAEGRVEVVRNETGEFEALLPEGPHRVILLLQTLLWGLALANNRKEADPQDMEIIRHVAFSSLPLKRRNLLQAVLLAGGSSTSTQIMRRLNISKPTAISRMRELAATGIAAYREGDQGSSRPAEIKLADKWQWLLDPNVNYRKAS